MKLFQWNSRLREPGKIVGALLRPPAGGVPRALRMTADTGDGALFVYWLDPATYPTGLVTLELLTMDQLLEHEVVGHVDGRDPAIYDGDRVLVTLIPGRAPRWAEVVSIRPPGETAEPVCLVYDGHPFTVRMDEILDHTTEAP